MNKAIVVTGGTKGIGKAIIERFAAESFDIITCARDEEGLRLLKEEISLLNREITVFSYKADLSVKSDVENFVKYALETGRPIHVLINNAGVFLPGQIQNEEEGILETTMQLNVYSAYYLTRGLMEHIKKNKTHIFNICSTASITAYTNGGSYCISKYALLGFSKVLREEMKNFGVRVTSVLPGATLTASWEGVDIPPERFMKPEDVAKVIHATYTLSENSVVEEILLRPQLGDI